MNKKGSATIEAAFGILLVMTVLMAVANFVSISYARNKISQQVEVFATKTSLNGGILYDDYDEFLLNLCNDGYDITGVVIGVKRVINGIPDGSDILLYDKMSANYVSINDNDNQIQLSITVPYKSGQIFYSLFQDLTQMQFERRVISRRE